jgi:DNA-binding LacI/PurR family transcriptional regulator
MREAGLAPRPALEVDFNLKELDPQILHALTRSPNRPSALFCGNDLLAMTVMRALREARPGLPTEMSIVGFDGLPVGELLSPPLTTVCQPNHEIGVQAWLQLHARMHGGETTLALVLPHRIRAGGTVSFYSL